jgi:dTDP-4-dehydrorhamnose 3,5-epimerase
MKINNTKFKGLKIIHSVNFKDTRGLFRESFLKKLFKKNNFVFQCVSNSKKNVLRGLHLQTKFPQGKYVSVLKGKILDIAIDLRKNSKTFGKHFKIVLSAKNAKSIFIPEGFAHGFLSLSFESIVHYSCTNYRSANHEVGIMWNDKDLKIKWPIKKPITSKKDNNNLTLKQFKNFYL